MSKAAFVRSLQSETIALSPFYISQRLRLAHGCVSVYQGDPKLPATVVRAYMVRFGGDIGTPERPILYQCVVALDQSPAWQHLAWIKEIIHILDRPEHRTHDTEGLKQLLDHRGKMPKDGAPLPLHVQADHNGLTLALGCALPQEYRHILRTEKYLEKYSAQQLEALLSVPAEYVLQILDPQFEGQFEAALISCDQT
jgi:hypothetical protein